MIEVGDDL